MAGTLAESAVALMETELFVEGMYRQLGVDFRGFETRRLQLKLDVLRERSGMDTISSLQGRVLRDHAFAKDAVKFVSESSSSLLDSAGAFMALHRAALPILCSSSWPVIWVAECADPGLLFQLAVMLEEEGLLGKTQLFVTSANDDLLAEVAGLRLSADMMSERNARHLEAEGQRSLLEYCERDSAGFTLRPELRKNIMFGQYDLSSDASFKEFELIICQRPFGDFDVGLQRRALNLFSQSLCNFGIVQLDASTGLLSTELARDFTCLLSERGIYKRVPRSPAS